VNHVARREKAAGREHNFACRQSIGIAGAANFFALGENPRSAFSVDCAVYTASAQKRAVGGVHDHVYVLHRDVCDQDENAAGEEGFEDFWRVHGRTLPDSDWLELAKCGKGPVFKQKARKTYLRG
jgi:hypothetical protein